MALKSTVFKAQLQVADLDRPHYATYALTLARHPSETDERMMLRLLAFALNADPQLAFAGDVGAAEEPSLWLRDLTGTIDCWIEVGLPEPKLLRRAAGRSARVLVYAYGRAAQLWWNEHRHALEQIDTLAVWQIAPATSTALAALAERAMQLQCLIQDGDVTLSTAHGSVAVELAICKPAAP